MQENMILLFSSDRFTEYEKDIYAIASLPSGYVYRFRYAEENTSDIIKEKYKSNSLSNSLALVVFVTKNESRDSDPSQLKYIPIRLARVIEIEFDTDTQMYHVYFELKEYVEIEDVIRNLDETPQDNIYFGNQVISPNYSMCSWKSIVEKLYEYKQVLFFRIHLDDSSGKEVKPILKDRNESHFELDEMKDYYLVLSIGNLCDDKGKQGIRTLLDASDFSSTLTKTIVPGLKYDHRGFKISGLELGDQSTRINLIKLTSILLDDNEEEKKSIYSVRLLFNVKKNMHRRRIYFLITFLLFLGTGALFTDFDEFICTSIISKIMTFLGLIAATWATAQLYSRFNKK